MDDTAFVNSSVYAMPGMGKYKVPLYTERVQDILNIVAEKTKASIERMQSRSRHASDFTLQARYIAFFLLRIKTNLTLKEIGLVLGKRDHSTVINGTLALSSWSSTNIELRLIVKDCYQSLKDFSDTKRFKQIGFDRRNVE